MIIPLKVLAEKVILTFACLKIITPEYIWMVKTVLILYNTNFYSNGILKTTIWIMQMILLGKLIDFNFYLAWLMERFEDILSLDEDMLGTEEYHISNEV